MAEEITRIQQRKLDVNLELMGQAAQQAAFELATVATAQKIKH